MQFGLGAAHQFAQRGIGFLDHAALVAHQQHVGHGREHAEDELLGLLQLGIFLLQLDFVVDELRIHLVHFLDHVHPGGLVQAFHGVARHQAFQTGRPAVGSVRV